MGGSEVIVRPIRREDLDCISGACWQNRETQIRLLEQQRILGMAAWQGDTCVGSLHCYRVSLPDWDDSNFPGYGRKRPVELAPGLASGGSEGKGSQV